MNQNLICLLLFTATSFGCQYAPDTTNHCDPTDLLPDAAAPPADAGISPAQCATEADCDDGNPCSVDSCVQGACTHTKQDGESCGMFCTCVQGSPETCGLPEMRCCAGTTTEFMCPNVRWLKNKQECYIGRCTLAVTVTHPPTCP